MHKEPKFFQDCNNCEYKSEIDGMCDCHMNPNFKKGDKLYCEFKKENKGE